jgi:hypothetical protein
MGCDYQVNQEAEKVKITVYDYNNPENEKTFEIPAEHFQKGKIGLEISGAQRR